MEAPSENSNQQTIDSYNQHVKEYINGTPQEVNGDVKVWVDDALGRIPTGGSVLELGSAFGRDADYIAAKGYNVQPTDATASFVELLQEKGHNARLLNAITDDFGGPYDMVFANAVLLHFTADETATVLAKAFNSLNPGGVLAFTVKKGNGEEWSEAKLNAPRYFHYWQQADLQNALEQAGFKDINISDGTTKNAEWLQVIATKQS